MSPSTNISLLLLTHNEAGILKKNFDWLTQCPNINEIIVIDDQSTDDTVKTVKTLKVPKSTKIKVISHPLNQDFSAQRQFGVDIAINDWILWLDPDETPDYKLITYLQSFNPNNESAFLIPRIDYFEGKLLKHGETGHSCFIRLFNRKYGKFIGKVHEVWFSSTPASNLKYDIYHHSHPNLKSFLEKINFYSEIRSLELYQQGINPSLFQIIFYPIGKFIINYWLKLGFLDGTPGIIMAITMSFHSFLVRAKLWKLSQP